MRRFRKLPRWMRRLLIEGETGTGKRIGGHCDSSRQPAGLSTFWPSIAGFTDSILGSQLFGHKKGAFTGAIVNPGEGFGAAQGAPSSWTKSAIFPLPSKQVFCALQGREVTRLGNQNRGRSMCAWWWRPITWRKMSKGPSGEISCIASRWLEAPFGAAAGNGRRCSLAGPCLSWAVSLGDGKVCSPSQPGGAAGLTAYPWPGNVRELKGAVESALIHCKGTVVQVGDLPPEIRASGWGDLCSPPARRWADSHGGGPFNRPAAIVQGGSSCRNGSSETFYRRLAEYDVRLGREPVRFHPHDLISWTGEILPRRLPAWPSLDPLLVPVLRSYPPPIPAAVHVQILRRHLGVPGGKVCVIAT